MNLTLLLSETETHRSKLGPPSDGYKCRCIPEHHHIQNLQVQHPARGAARQILPNQMISKVVYLAK